MSSKPPALSREATAGLPYLQPVLVGDDVFHFHGRHLQPEGTVFVLLGTVEPRPEWDRVRLYGTRKAMRQLAVALLNAADQDGEEEAPRAGS